MPAVRRMTRRSRINALHYAKSILPGLRELTALFAKMMIRLSDGLMTDMNVRLRDHSGCRNCLGFPSVGPIVMDDDMECYSDILHSYSVGHNLPVALNNDTTSTYLHMVWLQSIVPAALRAAANQARHREGISNPLREEDAWSDAISLVRRLFLALLDNFLTEDDTDPLANRVIFEFGNADRVSFIKHHHLDTFDIPAEKIQVFENRWIPLTDSDDSDDDEDDADADVDSDFDDFDSNESGCSAL